DISTGSLGQGVSVGAGMALAAKLHKRSYKTYVLVGDGECQEGQIWEAAMFGAQYELGNLIVIIDKNDLQVSGKTKDVISVDPLAQKWSSFKWDVHSADGHDPEQLLDCLGSLSEGNSPKVLITQTVKGKGISFMENNPDWHSFKKLTGEELKIAEQELGIKCLKKF
ncbi:MAG: transketolase, partial [Spirochaetes bacterium DG_61]